MADQLDEKIKMDYLDTWWGRFKFNRLVRRIYKQKIAALWEANLDKLYFETQHREQLSYDESADRRILSDEHKKAVAQQDQDKIAQAEERISNAKSIKAGYYKNEGFREELKTYIKMLELWMSRQKKSHLDL